MESRLLFLALSCIIFAGCGIDQTSKGPLPILGNKDVVNGDTIYHMVPDFSFTDQYGEKINTSTFADKAYIIDYFFTSCPTVCPRVKAQQLRLYEKYKNHPELSFLSVSIDPAYDGVVRLNKYAKGLGVEPGNWHFVTGNKDEIYAKAGSFFHTAIENEASPGGYDHDGKLVLIDKNRHIRGFCDALEPKDVDRFVYDIENLLNEH